MKIYTQMRFISSDNSSINGGLQMYAYLKYVFDATGVFDSVSVISFENRLDVAVV